MDFGVDDERNLFTLSKKDRSGQQQTESSEPMILYCLKMMHQEIMAIAQNYRNESRRSKNC